MPNSIVHFEIPADDVQRAKKFYEEAFGWKITDPFKMNYFFVETRGPGEPGINGGLMPRKSPDQPFMNYLDVDSIDTFCKKVEDAGGVVVLPKTEIGPGMGWIAAFKDTEGNMLGFHESPKRSAADKP
jgi:predicted enzyme related to lactoylglutathione lyase